MTASFVTPKIIGTKTIPSSTKSFILPLISYKIVKTVMDSWEKPHAVCLPLPSQGHINAMLKIAKLLHHKGFHITYVNTEFNNKRIIKSLGSKPLFELPDFRFKTILDGLPPSDLDASQDLSQLVDSLRKNFLHPFQQLIEKLNETSKASKSSIPSVTCIVADGFLPFASTVAKELEIPLVKFFPIAACGLMGFMQYPNLVERGMSPLKDESNLTNGFLDKTVDWIPGMKCISLKDLPDFCWTTNAEDVFLILSLETVDKVNESSAVVIHTFDALEKNVLDALSSMIPKLYSIGPLDHFIKHLPDTPLKQIGSSLWKEDTECLKWLNTKEPNSVLYVNFGSLAVLTPKQLVEFGWGLANSKVPFLWVIRPDIIFGKSAILSPEFISEIKERSLISSWCSQKEVLDHNSVGGFLTHSGWNSTLESLSSGVPMLCWHFFAEQPTNCHYICKEWGFGMEINNKDVKRHEVERLIKKLMEGEKGEKLREKSKEWKKLSEETTSQKGSSFINLDNLVSQILLAKAT